MKKSNDSYRRPELVMPRRTLLKGGAVAGLAGIVGAPFINRLQAKEAHPLAGKKIDMNILGIAGWLPSSLGVKMSPIFADYVKERFGYQVSFGFAEAPFSDLFQKAATSLATKSQEYNIIISDSQWLGALAKPGWILKLNDVIAKNKELQIDWYSNTITEAYQVYPDGSKDLVGSTPGGRHHRAVCSQGHAGRSEGAAGVPGEIQCQAAADLRGLREAHDG